MTDLSRNTKKEPGQALLMLIASMTLFGTIGIFRRLIPLPSDVLAFGRGAVGAVFLVVLVRFRGQRFAREEIRRKDFALLILTGAMIGFNWILLFEAYRYTTVAAATLCYYMAPVIVMLLSPLILKEKMEKKQAVCAALSVIGMVLVSGVTGGTSGGPEEIRGILLGLSAAVLYASVVLLNKEISRVPPYEKTIIQLFAAAGALLPYMAVQGTLRIWKLSTWEILLFIIVCIVHTGIAYALYFSALTVLPARTCALLSYIDPVTAVLLSALLLHETLTPAGAAGAVLIIGSAIFSEKA